MPGRKFLFRLAAHFKILDVREIESLPAEIISEWAEFAREEAFDLPSAARIIASTQINANPFRSGESVKPGDAVPYGWIEQSDFDDEGRRKPPKPVDPEVIAAKLNALTAKSRSV